MSFECARDATFNRHEVHARKLKQSVHLQPATSPVGTNSSFAHVKPVLRQSSGSPEPHKQTFAVCSKLLTIMWPRQTAL